MATGFVALRLSDGEKPLHLATDQIASFSAYDRYRPNYLSWVTTKGGDRFQVIESADEIAAALASVSVTDQTIRAIARDEIDKMLREGAQVDLTENQLTLATADQTLVYKLADLMH